LENLSVLQHCDIFTFFQGFSTCLLTFPCSVCMCRLLPDGPQQFFQTYGFVSLDASEKDEESATAKAAEAAAAAATAEAVEVAAAVRPCCCKLESTLLQS
jgi:hypothetical protein